MNDKLQDAINDSLVYLAEHANEYLESDAIERIYKQHKLMIQILNYIYEKQYMK